MLGTLITFLLGITVGVDEVRKENISEANKSLAQSNNDKFYYDGSNKQCSTETDEKCILVNDKGCLKMKGVKTGRTYEDIAKKKTNLKNDELKNNAKKFHYELFPQWTVKGSVCRLPVENETGKPFSLNWSKGSYYISYYDMNSKITPSIDIWSVKHLTDEEAKYYMP